MMSGTEFYVYLLRCADGSYYVGHTDDIETRVAAHNSGTIAGYTAARRPIELLWLQSFATRQQAFERERQLKGWSRAKKEALIRGDWDRIRQLARSRGLQTPAHPEPVEGRAGVPPRGSTST